MAGSFSLTAACRRLEEKVALITGGASGIGEVTAKLYMNHGAKVVIADIQNNLGQSLTQSLGSSNGIYSYCNVTNEDHIKEAVDKAVSTYGKLDIMFNNAGVFDSTLKISEIVNNEKTEFERVLGVNVVGVFLGMKHAARVMIPTRSECIISTGSLASALGGAATHAYTASKHAFVDLTKNLAVDLKKYGIRVNCVSPSGVTTPLVERFYGIEGRDELQKALSSSTNLKVVTWEADDVAKAALYLASDDAKCVSGHNLLVDGGYSICNSATNVF